VKQSELRFNAMREMTTAVVISLPHQVPETNRARMVVGAAVLEHSR